MITILRVQEYGDWARANVILQALSKGKLNDSARAEIDRQGKRLENAIKGKMIRNEAAGPPLTEATIKFKAEKGVSQPARKYIETGKLHDDIRVKPISGRFSSSNYAIHIGASFSPHKTSRSGRTLTSNSLLQTLEYGNSHIPARPIIRPTWYAMKDSVKQAMRSAVVGGIIRGGMKR